jgi:membrane fusion protein (multidrug efflux system)
MLLPGMYVRAVIDEAVDKNALLAPQQGITRDPRGNALALIVDGRDRIEQRSVVTDRAIGSDWLIRSGLSAGDRLVVQGLDKVHPGDTVVPVELGADTPRADARTIASTELAGGPPHALAPGSPPSHSGSPTSQPDSRPSRPGAGGS